MRLLRFLLITFLLGAMAQSASACTEPLGFHEAAHVLAGVPASVASGDVSTIGGEQHCDCPAALQNVDSAISEFGKSVLASGGADTGAVLHRADSSSLLLAENFRAENFLARRAAKPLSLPVFRLRQ